MHSRRDFGITIAGEFSGSPNDCGLFLHGVGQSSTNPQCPVYNDWEAFNATMKEGVKNFVMASMDALGDWFFWTWKVLYQLPLPVFPSLPKCIDWPQPSRAHRNSTLVLSTRSSQWMGTRRPAPRFWKMRFPRLRRPRWHPALIQWILPTLADWRTTI